MPKISELDEKVTPDQDDLLSIVDVAGGVTKRVRIVNLGIQGHINQSEIHRNIVYNDACGFIEILI